MTTKPFILTAEDRVKLTNRVRNELKPGHQNAVRGKDLAIRLGQNDDRKIRLIIRELIATGVPIASSVSEPMGYYIITNEYEAHAYIRVLTERIKEDTARLNDFKRAAGQSFHIPEYQCLLYLKNKRKVRR